MPPGFVAYPGYAGLYCPENGSLDRQDPTPRVSSGKQAMVPGCKMGALRRRKETA